MLRVMKKKLRVAAHNRGIVLQKKLGQLGENTTFFPRKQDTMKFDFLDSDFASLKNEGEVIEQASPWKDAFLVPTTNVRDDDKIVC